MDVSKIYESYSCSEPKLRSIINASEFILSNSGLEVPSHYHDEGALDKRETNVSLKTSRYMFAKDRFGRTGIMNEDKLSGNPEDYITSLRISAPVHPSPTDLELMYDYSFAIELPANPIPLKSASIRWESPTEDPYITRQGAVGMGLTSAEMVALRFDLNSVVRSIKAVRA